MNVTLMFEYDARPTIAVERCQVLVRSTLTAPQLKTLPWEGLVERSVMQMKETKGRKTFWPWAEDLHWACSCCPLRGNVHLKIPWPCRSWPCPELAERTLLKVPSRAPAVLPLCQAGFAPSPCSCCSGCACPVLQSLSHSFPFLTAQSRASLAKLDVRSMHWNGGVRAVSNYLKWCSCKLCLFGNILCYGRV